MRRTSERPLSDTAVDISRLSHYYGERQALQQLSFSVKSGEIFSLVGPNGGGKSTTFKVLSTLVPPQSGEVKLFGYNLKTDAAQARKLLGIVFQNPALDKKLSVEENLLHQGHLYGMSGTSLRSRISSLLTQFGISDRRSEKTEVLSGGLKRRVEIAKALLHSPKLLILDEPTTGLDPLARRELWDNLRELKEKRGVTILLTTHLLEEAEMSDTVAFLDKGIRVALGSPAELKALVGAEVISLTGPRPEALKQEIERRFQLTVSQVGNEVRVQKEKAHEFIPALVGTLTEQIESIRIGKPSLEDLFIQKTGRHFFVEATS